MKWIVGMLVVFLPVRRGWYSSGTTKTSGSRWSVLAGDKPSEVRMEKAGKGELSRTISAPGQIEPRTNVKISAQVSARIIALPFRENDPVKKGTWSCGWMRRTCRRFAGLGKAGLKGSRRGWRGAQAAMQSGAGAGPGEEAGGLGGLFQGQLEAAENAYLQAGSLLRATEHSIEQPRAQIVRAEKDLENTTIMSPIDGTITQLDAEVGSWWWSGR